MITNAASGRGVRGGALITGAARRIGRKLALSAAAAGYDVALHVRAVDSDAGAVLNEVRALGARADIVTASLDRDDELLSLVERAVDAVGPLTLLVNNASLFENDRIGTLTPASWDAHMSANLRAPVLLAQAFAVQAPRDADALIVNLLDQRVFKPNPQYFSYGVAKAALWQATRMLAQGLAPHIRVNGIGPGPTLPNLDQTPEAFAAEAAATPLGRGGSLDEIAAALCYLIDATSVTGQMIAVDGGQHLAWRTPDILDP